MLVTKNLSHNVVGGAEKSASLCSALQNDRIMIQCEYNYNMKGGELDYEQ